MKKFAACDPVSGVVKFTTFAADDFAAPAGDGFRYVEIGVDVEPTNTHYNGNEFVARNTGEIDELITIATAIGKRRAMLFDSDWTQYADVPMSNDLRQAWAAYRQALRDITEQPGYPTNIVWPERPQGA